MGITRGETERLVLREAPAQGLEALRSREERLVFWINAYNRLVAEGIRALDIRQSVWEAPDLFDRISYGVGGLVFSANEIEHGVLRGNRPNPLSGVAPFGADDPRCAHVIAPPDPRMHFAISCGARSCPPVRIYEAEGLEEQLGTATRDFVGREVTLEGDRLVLSPIFNWFREDFGDLPAFLAHHLEDGAVRRAVLGGGLSGADWREYDWSVSR